MIAERILMGLLLGGVAIGCVLVLYPFLSALLWAGILVYTTWPVFEWLRLHLHLRRMWAAVLMVTLTAVVLVLPIGVAAPGSADDVTHLRHAIMDGLRAGLPDSPIVGVRHPAGRQYHRRSVEPLGRRHQRDAGSAASLFRHRRRGRAEPAAGHRQRRADVSAGAVRRVFFLRLWRADRRTDAPAAAPHRRRCRPTG